MNISKDNINGVKNLPGVNVTSCIVPCTDEDNYATHDSFYGKGGWREVETIAERDAIPMERRKVGMAVRVTSINKTYILKYSTNNYCWYEDHPSNASDIINEAISQGSINVDLTGCVNQHQLEDALVPYMKTSVCESALTNLDTAIKNWVNSQNFLTEHQSLEDYVTRPELAGNIVTINDSIAEVENSISGLEEDLENLTNEHTSYVESNNATIADMKADIVELEEAIGGGEEQSFATKEELNELSEREQNDMNTMLENITTIADNYATKSECGETFSTKDELNAAASSLRLLMNGYAKSTDIIPIVQSLNLVDKAYLRGYATEFYVQDYVASAMAGRIKPGQPLVDYSTEIEQLKAQIQELTERINDLQG